MRHRVQKHHFNRDTKDRKALFMNLVRSLILHGSVVTTREKAKEVRRISDKLIHRAKTDDISTRRQLHRFFGKRDVVNVLIESVAKAMPEKQSGFTTLTDVGVRRGDNALLTKLALVKKDEKVVKAEEKKKPEVKEVAKTETADKKPAKTSKAKAASTKVKKEKKD